MLSHTAKRAVRASVRPLRTTAPAAAVTLPRHLHNTRKAEAVEAVAHTPSAFTQPPPPFLQQGFVPQKETPKQLNVHEQQTNPRFYQTIAEIMKLREKYLEDRSIFVESEDMIRICLGLGANPEDVEKMTQISNILYTDPTLPFRRSRNGRFCIDFETNQLRRLEFQPFTLTEGEDFKRYDSGQIRRFDEIQDNLQLNSVLQALFVFKAMIINGVEIANRPNLQYDAGKWVCTLFNVRTFTNSKVLGEPALEGVHSDGVDHTMTTFLGSENMAPHSAATYMHSMEETTGVQVNETNPLHLLSRVQHRKVLDTLILVDHERKHSLSPVYPINKDQEATRDMLVFFTRRPVEKGHVSASIDSLTPHSDLPMEIPLFVPKV